MFFFTSPKVYFVAVLLKLKICLNPASPHHIHICIITASVDKIKLKEVQYFSYDCITDCHRIKMSSAILSKRCVAIFRKILPIIPRNKWSTQPTLVLDQRPSFTVSEHNSRSKALQSCNVSLFLFSSSSSLLSLSYRSAISRVCWVSSFASIERSLGDNK